MRAPVEQRLRVAGDLGLRHREAHVGEEAARAALADVPLGVRVRLGGRRSDDVDPELRPRSSRRQLGRPVHRRGFVPVKAIRIHEDGGPEVLRYEDAPDPEPGPGEVLSGCGRPR